MQVRARPSLIDFPGSDPAGADRQALAQLGFRRVSPRSARHASPASPRQMAGQGNCPTDRDSDADQLFPHPVPAPRALPPGLCHRESRRPNDLESRGCAEIPATRTPRAKTLSTRPCATKATRTRSTKATWTHATEATRTRPPSRPDARHQSRPDACHPSHRGPYLRMPRPCLRCMPPCPPHAAQYLRACRPYPSRIPPRMPPWKPPKPRPATCFCGGRHTVSTPRP